MKENRLSKMLAVGAISALALTTAVAQETTTVTRSTDPVTGTTTTESATTTSVGTIAAAPASDYISFRTSTTAEPVKYYYTKRTTIVDPTGRTVEWSAVRPDVPATVYYVKEGERYERRPVTVGTINYKFVEILSGVEAGDQVVTAGAYQIKNMAKGGGEEGGHHDDH